MVTVLAGREARRDTGIQGGFASCARRIEGFAEATRGHPWSTSRLLAVGPGMALPPQCDRGAPTTGAGASRSHGERLTVLAECTWGGAEPPAARLSTHRRAAGQLASKDARGPSSSARNWAIEAAASSASR